MRAATEKSSNATVTGSTDACPPVSTGSNTPERKSASRGAWVQPTSTITESPSAGCLPTSSPPSTTRSDSCQLSPASSRAASAAATSEPSTDCAKRTFSTPCSRTIWASASTRGCGSGASSAGSSTTYTFVAP